MRQVISKYLSQARFSRYLAACDADFDRALSLYEANIRLSGTAMEAVNIVEVTLRNAIDLQLRRWNLEQIGSESWTTAPAPDLAEALNGGKELERARAGAARDMRSQRNPSHDDIVARLTFGTWFYLLPSGKQDSRQVLWDAAIKNAFPMRHNVRSAQIKQSIRIVYDLRNRVAHFEPIYSLKLEGKRSAMAKTLHMIDRPMEKWFASVERFSDEIKHFRSEWPEFNAPPQK